MDLLISLLSGAVGGNVAGGLLKNLNMGVLGNSIAGIAGGGLGGQILAIMSGGAADTSGILGQAASGGIGGAVVLAVVSMIRKALVK